MAREDIYHYCASDPVYDPEWHWITEQIALGSYPLEDELQRLLDGGVRAILSVRSEHPDYDGGRFEHSLALLVDDWELVPYDALVKALRFVHTNVAAQRPVYVHCFAGMSRSVFVVVCYLMLTRGMPFGDAVEYVRERRPIASPHPGLWNDELLERLQREKAAILTPVEEPN